MDHPDIARVSEHLRTGDRPVVFFVGAGLSRPLGFPSWHELMDRLISYGCRVNRLDSTEAATAQRLLHQADYLPCGDYLRAKMGTRVDQHLCEIFGRPLPPDLGSYEYLVRLPCAGFVTTNYDGALEAAYAKHFREPLVGLIPDDITMLGTLADRRPFLIKLHGDVARRRFVLGGEDYARIEQNEVLSRFIYSLFFNYELVFLGYGLADRDILLPLQLLGRDYAGQGPRHVAMLPTDTDHRVRMRLEDEFGIDIALYDTARDGHRPVAEVVAQWFLEFVQHTNAPPVRESPVDYAALLQQHPKLLLPEQRSLCESGLRWLLELPVHWGTTADTEARPANIAEGLLALAATKISIGHGIRPADEVGALLTFQNAEGAFVSPTIQTTNTHTHALAMMALGLWSDLHDGVPAALDRAVDWLHAGVRVDEPGWSRFPGDDHVSVVSSLHAFAALLRTDAFPADLWRAFHDRLIACGAVRHGLRTSGTPSPVAAGWLLWLLGQIRDRGLHSARDDQLVGTALTQLSDPRLSLHSEHEAFAYRTEDGRTGWLSWHHPPAAAVVLGALAWFDSDHRAAAGLLGRALAALVQQAEDSARGQGPVTDNLGGARFTFPTMYAVWALGESLQRFGGNVIRKAGLVLMHGRHLLLVRSRGRDALILPGGAIEGDESVEQAIRREVREELGVEVQSARCWRTFEDVAAFEPGVRVRIESVRGRITGIPVPGAEISQIVWFDIDETDQSSLSPIIRNQVIPALLEEDHR
ncbi:SIR2 family protein [Nocardia farcinica]|uniref:SIR2 family protein n=1 Tax=Nocardia farcinica TaxID=37329 RepID=UPI0015F106D1|nr:SIR2 family protein [Nocardia farcinica]MBA4855357.1 SIR2 family protein [Nocardia farcinica]MBC9818304.1 SIR2 family protein [Nocardia farcinica]